MGIRFKNIHSDSIPAVWKTVKRPFLPTPKISTFNLPEADSEIDLSEYNDDNRLHYEDRIFEGVISCTDKDLFLMQLKINKLSSWLIGGWGELEFDDMRGTIWTAKVENADISAYELGRIGTATVYFRVKPFPKWEINSQTGQILLNSDVLLNSNIPLDTVFSDTYNFDDSTSITLKNWGNWYTKTIVEIRGTFTTITFTMNGKSFTYARSSISTDVIAIKPELLVVTRGGLQDNPYSSGDFKTFELIPSSNNTMVITSNGAGEVKFIHDYYFVNMAVIE
jgi:hypothetical protein